MNSQDFANTQAVSNLSQIVRKIPPTDNNKRNIGHIAFQRGMVLYNAGKIKQGVGDLKNAIIFLDGVKGLSNICIPIAKKKIKRVEERPDLHSVNVNLSSGDQYIIKKWTDLFEKRLTLLFAQREEEGVDIIIDDVLHSQPLEDDPEYTFYQYTSDGK